MDKQIQPPLIVHIIYRLGVGGLENGLVNIINRLPVEAYRHAIICLTDSTDFAERLQRKDVAIYEIHKRAGQDWLSFFKIYQLLKQLQPSIVHTRNLAAIEYQLCAWLAGVSYRVHGEHGWDVFDPEGHNVKYQWLRRIMGLLIHRFVPLSRHLESYLSSKAGIPVSKITRICNGVDTRIFYPSGDDRQLTAGCTIDLSGKIVFGTVGRMHGVKDQITLVKAFLDAAKQSSSFRDQARLILIGDGPLREPALELLSQHGLAENAWLPGERSDIGEILRTLDVFVLPSQAEGISNTLLEAMASGLPVIATRVGGNPELVLEGETGLLVDKENPQQLAEAMLGLFKDLDLRQRFAKAGLNRVLEEFTIDGMVTRYQRLYDKQ
jgi:sugar transferase (PEP-CTERM/EpsH1 system associated)